MLVLFTAGDRGTGPDGHCLVNTENSSSPAGFSLSGDDGLLTRFLKMAIDRWFTQGPWYVYQSEMVFQM